jgi:trk system potassium uptake protein TrkH
MAADHEQSHQFLAQRSYYPARSLFLRRADVVIRIVATISIIVAHGLWRRAERPWEFGAVAVAGLAIIAVAIVVRYYWSLWKRSFWRRNLAAIAVSTAWLMTAVLVFAVVPLNSAEATTTTWHERWDWFASVSEWLMVFYAVCGVMQLMRAAASGVNAAVLLVGSFAALIALGTALLMLPRCREPAPDGAPQRAPFSVALFTSTSASCVTGLVVVDTAPYWSRTGEVVILGLMQTGGLGIMTFGAFFAVVAGRGVQLREHANLRELMAAEGAGSVRSLALAIIGVTLGAELLGAVLLSDLWSDLPWPERAFQSVFHSVSAFCNAGFALTPDSFVGMGERWPVCWVVTGLIILGGLGFPVLQNLARAVPYLPLWRGRGLFHEPRRRARLSLSTKLVLITTASLLAGGTAAIYLLELTGVERGTAPPLPLADAWFQSVTFRTAGFNTVNLDALQPATKLLAIGLMFVGASPGSTGGGIKTIVLALSVLGLLSTLRGREHVECAGRTVPFVLVNRALAIAFLGLATLMSVTILLVIFEQRPGEVLDYLFEAASALGTVGVSAAVELETGEVVSTTKSLSTASQFVIIVSMFLGRIGPLTLMMALAGAGSRAQYEFPEERVLLG